MSQHGTLQDLTENVMNTIQIIATQSTLFLIPMKPIISTPQRDSQEGHEKAAY